jgi:hypothetical protein
MPMNIMPMGDYYVWYCEWCDSRNLTAWVRVDRGSVCCSACQKRFEISRDGDLMSDENNGIESDEVLLSGIAGGSMTRSNPFASANR